eukprot:scaffold2260_cov65-Phaeocystis_antarctica.AAC.2
METIASLQTKQTLSRLLRLRSGYRMIEDPLQLHPKGAATLVAVTIAPGYIDPTVDSQSEKSPRHGWGAWQRRSGRAHRLLHQSHSTPCRHRPRLLHRLRHLVAQHPSAPGDDLTAAAARHGVDLQGDGQRPAAQTRAHRVGGERPARGTLLQPERGGRPHPPDERGQVESQREKVLLLAARKVPWVVEVGPWVGASRRTGARAHGHDHPLGYEEREQQEGGAKLHGAAPPEWRFALTLESHRTLRLDRRQGVLERDRRCGQGEQAAALRICHRRLLARGAAPCRRAACGGAASAAARGSRQGRRASPPRAGLRTGPRGQAPGRPVASRGPP